jgi:hypothetical protein
MSTYPEIELLNARVARLEKQNGRLKLSGGAVVLACALTLGVTAMKPAGNIVAERFVLVDKAGKQRGVWEEKNGVVMIELSDGNTPRSRWMADANSSGMVLWSPSFYPGVWLSASKHDATVHMIGPVGAAEKPTEQDAILDAAQAKGVIHWAYLGAGADSRLIVEGQPNRRIDLWTGRPGSTEGPALQLQSPAENRKLFLGQHPGNAYRLTFIEQNTSVYEIPPKPSTMPDFK